MPQLSCSHRRRGANPAPTFDDDRLLGSPDLAAFLVVQLEVLAELADELARPTDASAWRTERAVLAEALVGMWDGTAFVPRSAVSGRPAPTTSLVTLLPLLAADVLDPEMVDVTVVGSPRTSTPCRARGCGTAPIPGPPVLT